MSCRNDKMKYRCGTYHLDECTTYSGDLPEWSELQDETCVTLKESTEELYGKVTEIKDDIELTRFSNCIDYNEEEVGKPKIDEVLTKHHELLCEILGTDMSKDVSPDISRWGLDFKCLVDQCANPPSTLKQLLQLLINSVCNGIPEPPEPTDNFPRWEDVLDGAGNRVVACSTSASSFVPGENGEYSFERQVDTNFSSYSHGEYQWERNPAGDGGCYIPPQTNNTPDWQDVMLGGAPTVECSNSSVAFNPSPTGTYSWKLQYDANPESPTYSASRWEYAPSFNGQCSGVNTTPDWQDETTGSEINVYCSSSITTYVASEEGRFAFKKQNDVNPNTSTPIGQRVRYVRYPEGDNQCGNTTANWQCVTDNDNNCIRGCSSSQTVYTPSGTGKYSWVQEIDENPNSSTFLDTRWTRDSNNDDQCSGAVWEDSTGGQGANGEIVSCSSTEEIYTEDAGGAYAFKRQEDINPASDTFGQYQWVRDDWNDGMCVGVPSTDPEWEVVIDNGLPSVVCSTSNTTYVPTVGEYAWALEQNTNIHSITYGETRYEYHEEYNGYCTGVNITPQWHDRIIDGERVISCSISPVEYQPMEDGAFAWKQQQDTNPNSTTYEQTRWVPSGIDDGLCLEEVEGE